MKLLSLPLLLALLALSHAATAQVFKWVDDKGVTHFSDQPPPASAKAKAPAAVKTAGGSGGDSGAGLPYELAQAVRNHPVVMYTSSPCAPCEQGRSLLSTRGIPFTEKSVATDADIAQMKAAGGDGQMPLLFIGRSKITGFQEGAWNAALSAASYPATRMLPANYKVARTESAAPKAPEAKPDVEQSTAAAVAAAKAEAARVKRLPPVNAPTPDFRF
jgi:glutaredoxin